MDGSVIGTREKSTAGRESPAPSISALIDGQADRRPDAVAVTCGDRELSYRELTGRADRLAAGLRARGVRGDDVVAVLMDRSADLVVALLGILKAGAAYLALDPADPPRRLADLIADSGARTAVSTAELADRLPLPPVIINDTADGPAQPAASPATPGSLAYVCYTSGSTGAPKGVGVTHAGVLRLVRAGQLRIDEDDVVLQAASPSFDASTLEIFGALANGAELAVVPGGAPLDLDELARTAGRRRVTVMNLPTGLLHRLAESRLPVFAGVRHVITGGDVAAPALVADLLRAHPGLLFTNGYGPTENTTFTTCWSSTRPPVTASVPIGHPIDGTGVELLDAQLRPVAEGELYTWGDGLARGYLGRAAATAERFLPCPFGPPGSRMYRTGDLARRLPGGDLEFAGRVDRQVKIRGYRVEPGSVEAVLSAQPGVRQAAVVVERDSATGNRLTGHVVAVEPAAGADLDADLGAELRERLREVLPGYAVPEAILVRASMPTTGNGKVDREALITGGRRPRSVTNPFVPPTDDLQRQVVRVWGTLLRTDPIGIDDDFFELGGHSLMAAELLDLMRTELGVDVPARTLYLRSTVAELSEAVRELLDRRAA